MNEITFVLSWESPAIPQPRSDPDKGKKARDPAICRQWISLEVRWVAGELKRWLNCRKTPQCVHTGTAFRTAAPGSQLEGQHADGCSSITEQTSLYIQHLCITLHCLPNERDAVSHLHFWRQFLFEMGTESTRAEPNHHHGCRSHLSFTGCQPSCAAHLPSLFSYIFVLLRNKKRAHNSHYQHCRIALQ